ncbi:hypothetical protein Q7P36_007573 [Cladosporium allicinum]
MNGRRAHHAIGSWIFHDMKCRPSNERLIFGWEERVPIDMSPTLITISPDHSHRGKERISILPSSSITSNPEHINNSSIHPSTAPKQLSNFSPNQPANITTMQFTTFAFAAFAALTSAAAIEKRSPLEQRAPINLCPAIDTPQCCQLDVDGVAAVTCSAPESDLTTVADFVDSCAAEGLSALCCTVPVAGLGLLCAAP